MDNDLMARRLRPPSEPTNPLDPFDVKSQVARNWQFAAPSTDPDIDESAEGWEQPALAQGDVDAPWAATAQEEPNYPDAQASVEAAVFPDAPALPEAPVFPEDPLFPESTSFPEAPALPETQEFADVFGYQQTTEYSDDAEVHADPEPTFEQPAAEPATAEFASNEPADDAAEATVAENADTPEFDEAFFARAAASQFASAVGAVFGTAEPRGSRGPHQCRYACRLRAGLSLRAGRSFRADARNAGLDGPRGAQRRPMGSPRWIRPAHRHGLRRAACL